MSCGCEDNDGCLGELIKLFLGLWILDLIFGLFDNDKD